MPEYPITITFLSDWHVGSGLGDGALADSILNRDAWGIPFIPGRGVKGALREGAWRLGLAREDLEQVTKKLFGSNSVEAVSNQAGLLKVAPGQLRQDLLAYLRSMPEPKRSKFVDDMTIYRQQTSLMEDGQVKPHSLRTIECGIPGLVFESSISIEREDEWLPLYFAAICASVKSIGGDRARGLGKCRVEMNATGPVAMPPQAPAWLTGESR